MFSNKEKLEEANEKLKQSRNLLLSRLISGKLPVGESAYPLSAEHASRRPKRITHELRR